MNLFRSEEHARKWRMFDPEFEKALKPLSFYLDLFSEQFFRERRRPDYVSWIGTVEGKQAVARLMSRVP